MTSAYSFLCVARRSFLSSKVLCLFAFTWLATVGTSAPSNAERAAMTAVNMLIPIFEPISDVVKVAKYSREPRISFPRGQGADVLGDGGQAFAARQDDKRSERGRQVVGAT